MRVFEPKVSVKLIKSFTRKEIVDGVPISSRYESLGAVDLTPFLGDGGGVKTSKSVREPAGGFTLTLCDFRDAATRETIYALIEPMDMVEIRFAHDPYAVALAAETEPPADTTAEEKARIQAEIDKEHSLAIKAAAEKSVHTKLANMYFEDYLTAQKMADVGGTRDAKEKMISETALEKKYKAEEDAHAAKEEELIRKRDGVGKAVTSKKVDISKGMPIVMRGLVTAVSRREIMGDGRPTRTIVVAGQDFGKLLQIYQIYYLDNAVIGDNLLTEFKFFHKYIGAGTEKAKPATEFIQEVATNVLTPYLKDFAQFAVANAKSVGASVLTEWTVKANIPGNVSPWVVCQFNNISLWQLLHSVLDIGPFNEMFVEDAADAINLVVRQIPYLDAAGKQIQGDPVAVSSVSGEEIIEQSLTRTDAGLANLYWASNATAAMMNNEDARRQVATGAPETYIFFKYPNCASDRYGVRKMEVTTTLLPPEYVSSDAQTKVELPEQGGSLLNWMANRRKTLAAINKDNVLFEHGTIRIRGRESIKAGTYIEVSRGNGVVSKYYVVKVDHDFLPYRAFTTTLTVERGTNFIERAKSKDPLYFPEMNGGGVK